MRPWQFTIRDLLFATAAIALVLGWLVTFAPILNLKRYGIYPGLYPGPWGLVSVGVLVYGWFVLRRPNGASRACILIVVAWYIALGNTVWPMPCGFTHWTGSEQHRQLWQEGIHVCLLTGITLPVFFTLPLVYAVITRGRGTLDPVTRWLLLSLAIPLADAILMTILVSGTFGAWRF